jgi:hypothetical protein
MWCRLCNPEDIDRPHDAVIYNNLYLPERVPPSPYWDLDPAKDLRKAHAKAEVRAQAKASSSSAFQENMNAARARAKVAASTPGNVRYNPNAASRWHAEADFTSDEPMPPQKQYRD